MGSTNNSNIPPRPSSKELALLVLCLLVSFTSISTQSFWIDEGNSALRAIQPTLAEFWVQNIRFGGSDLQMPGYMLSLWAWEKAFGPSEYALRALNIPFFLVTVCAVLFAFQEKTRIRLLFATLLCLSPMVWIYMDEARPYIIQLTGATLMLIGMVNQGRNPVSIEKNLTLFCIGTLVLCAASLTGVVFAFFFALGYMAILLNQKILAQIFHSRLNLFVLTSSLLILIGLGAYYFWTLQMGVGASNVAKTSLSSLAFAFYELMGFMGLGPDRLELRSQGISSLSPFLVGIITFAIATLLVATAPLRKLISNPPPSWAWIIASAGLVGAAAMASVGFSKDFRIIGRHMLPLLPFYLFFIASCLCGLWYSGKKLHKFLVFIFILLLTISSLTVRIHERYQKDDYRSAASRVRNVIEQGLVSWWAADRSAAEYYSLTPLLIDPAIANTSNEVGVFMANNRDREYLNKLPHPSLVVLSKNDVYDNEGHLRRWLAENGFTLEFRKPAFEFYTKVRFRN
jgi:hypothetical protein